MTRDDRSKARLIADSLRLYGVHLIYNFKFLGISIWFVLYMYILRLKKNLYRSVWNFKFSV